MGKLVAFMCMRMAGVNSLKTGYTQITLLVFGLLQAAIQRYGMFFYVTYYTDVFPGTENKEKLCNISRYG